ncbi:MAG: TonB-dependent receptor, partial [Acidobacteria bacterium]|nr:TonB-dependent receptor [Acidobacteriota bacterium]
MFNTKSGTNQVHASAFWNLRRDIFEAAGWSSNQTLNRTPGFRSKVRFNEEGGTAGGPVWIPKVYDGRNKTFFYFTYVKDIRPASPIITVGETVPTALMKQGNFNELGYPIYDPSTTALVNGTLTRTPFANNTIPKAQWSNISTNMIPVIPDPNSGGGLTSNYTLVGGSNHDDTIYTVKADHAFNNAHRVSFFMTRRNYMDIAPSQFTGPLSNGLLSGQYPEDYRGNYDWVISPTKLLHITFGNSQTIQRWNNPEQRGNGSRFGFPGLTGKSDATPYISFTTDNLTGWGMSQGKVDNGGQFNYTYQWSGQMSWVRGKHEYKFGADVRRLMTTGDDWAGTNGSYVFSRFQTADPLRKSTTGNAFASFLLGAPDSANQTNLPVVIGQIRYGYHAGYFQDNWRVNPRLTINYGVRYEVPIGWHSRDGLYSNLDVNKPNPGAGGLPGAIVFAGVGAGRSGVKRFYPTDLSNVGPRAGFAYRLGDKTTLRGGFGIFYQTLGNGGCGCTDGIGGAPVSAVSDGLNPAINWDNGIRQAGSGPVDKRFDPTVDNFVSGVYRQGPNYGKAPRIYNWSFTIQHELKSFLFEAAYVGNRGNGLNSTVYINELPFKYLALGPLLGKNINDPAVVAANYKEPFAGFASGWGGGATLAQSLRPFPQYGTVVDVNAGVGKTWYDAMQSKVERKFGNLQFMGSYVWSKSLALMTYRQIFSQGAQVQAQDASNINDAKSLMFFDIPHFVNLLTSYRLPIGKGQKFFGSANRVT